MQGRQLIDSSHARVPCASRVGVGDEECGRDRCCVAPHGSGNKPLELAEQLKALIPPEYGTHPASCARAHQDRPR